MARCHIHELAAAVVALEDGRALLLAEQLELWDTADRLRRSGHSGPARRLEVAAHLG